MPKQTPIDEYIEIYHEYHVLNYSVWEISQKHNCSDDKIRDAINYVDNQTLSLPTKSLLNGAITSIRERLKNNKQELSELQKKENKNYPIIIAFNREIRSDEQLLHKLQGLMNLDVSKFSNNEPIQVAMPGLTHWLFKILVRKHAEGITDVGEIIKILEDKANQPKRESSNILE